MHWEIISPDLTRNDKTKQVAAGGPITKDNTGIEVYDTIFAVTESPKQKDLIWTGSDDGLDPDHDRCAERTGRTLRPRRMPEWGTVSMIEASPFDAGTAYVAVERHKMDDFAPYAFKTKDFGKNWSSITNGIPADDYVHAVREDPARKGLLYAGTEKASTFRLMTAPTGRHFRSNLPARADLGPDSARQRSGSGHAWPRFWILDDLSPLRQYQPEIANAEVHLYTPDVTNHTTVWRRLLGGGGQFADRILRKAQ